MKQEHLLTYVLVVFFLFLTSFSNAQDTIRLTEIQEDYVLSPHISVLEDKHGSLSLDEVRNPAFQQQFIPFSDWKVPDYHVKVQWVRLTLENQLPEEVMQIDWLLALHPYNPDIVVYTPLTEGYHAMKAGKYLAYQERTYKAVANMSRTSLRLSLLPNQPTTLYIKFTEVRETRKANLEMKLVSIEKFSEETIFALLFSAFMFGGLFLMIIIVITLNWYAWKPEYSYYLAYLIALLFVEVLTTGIDTIYISSQFGLASWWGEEYVWANMPELRALLDVRWYLASAAYLLFIRAYLDIKNILPSWDIIIKAMLSLGIIMMVYSIYSLIQSGFDVHVFENHIAFYIILYYITTLGFLFSLYKTGNKKVMIATIAFLVIIAGTGTRLFSILLDNAPSEYINIFMIGSLFIEKIIFTFALSFRQRKTEKKLRIEELEKRELLQQKNEALQILNEKTLAISEAKQSFLTMVSHELRTPMNAIMGFTELLIEDNPRQNQQFYLDNLDISNKGMLKMIDNLLHLLDLDSKKATLVSINFNLHDLLDDVIKEFQNCNKNNLLQIQLLTNKDTLPKYLKGDRKCLRQILEHLLDNAIKFTKEGEACLKVERIERQDAYIKINFKVIDTGIGIPLEKQAFIFEAFSQVSNSFNRDFDGLGIGLPLTKQLVELHQSKIKLESEVNKGSTFSFDLTFPLPSQ